MSSQIFLFIDESGDLGDSNTANSPYYIELALQITEERLEDFLTHITNWRYIKHIIREPKNISANKLADI